MSGKDLIAAAAKGWAKFQAPSNFIKTEQQTKTMEPTERLTSKFVLDQLDILIKTTSSKGEKSRYEALKADIQAMQATGEFAEKLIVDFILWILGRSSKNVVYEPDPLDPNGTRARQANDYDAIITPWGNKPYTFLPDVKNFIDSIVDERMNAMKYLTKLKLRWPRNLEELWIWWKYIVHKQGLNGLVVEYARYLEPYDFLPPDELPYVPPSAGQAAGENKYTYFDQSYTDQNGQFQTPVSQDVEPMTPLNPNPPPYSEEGRADLRGYLDQLQQAMGGGGSSSSKARTIANAYREIKGIYGYNMSYEDRSLVDTFVYNQIQSIPDKGRRERTLKAFGYGFSDTGLPRRYKAAIRHHVQAAVRNVIPAVAPVAPRPRGGKVKMTKPTFTGTAPSLSTKAPKPAPPKPGPKPGPAPPPPSQKPAPKPAPPPPKPRAKSTSPPRKPGGTHPHHRGGNVTKRGPAPPVAGGLPPNPVVQKKTKDGTEITKQVTDYTYEDEKAIQQALDDFEEYEIITDDDVLTPKKTFVETVSSGINSILDNISGRRAVSAIADTFDDIKSQVKDRASKAYDKVMQKKGVDPDHAVQIVVSKAMKPVDQVLKIAEDASLRELDESSMEIINSTEDEKKGEVIESLNQAREELSKEIRVSNKQMEEYVFEEIRKTLTPKKPTSGGSSNIIDLSGADVTMEEEFTSKPTSLSKEQKKIDKKKKTDTVSEQDRLYQERQELLRQELEKRQKEHEEAVYDEIKDMEKYLNGSEAFDKWLRESFDITYDDFFHGEFIQDKFNVMKTTVESMKSHLRSTWNKNFYLVGRNPEDRGSIQYMRKLDLEPFDFMTDAERRDHDFMKYEQNRDAIQKRMNRDWMPMSRAKFMAQDPERFLREEGYSVSPEDFHAGKEFKDTEGYIKAGLTLSPDYIARVWESVFRFSHSEGRAHYYKKRIDEPDPETEEDRARKAKNAKIMEDYEKMRQEILEKRKQTTSGEASVVQHAVVTKSLADSLSKVVDPNSPMKETLKTLSKVADTDIQTIHSPPSSTEEKEKKIREKRTKKKVEKVEKAKDQVETALSTLGKAGGTSSSPQKLAETLEDLSSARKSLEKAKEDDEIFILESGSDVEGQSPKEVSLRKDMRKAAEKDAAVIEKEVSVFQSVFVKEKRERDRREGRIGKHRMPLDPGDIFGGGEEEDDLILIDDEDVERKKRLEKKGADARMLVDKRGQKTSTEERPHGLTPTDRKKMSRLMQIEEAQQAIEDTKKRKERKENETAMKIDKEKQESLQAKGAAAAELMSKRGVKKKRDDVLSEGSKLTPSPIKKKAASRLETEIEEEEEDITQVAEEYKADMARAYLSKIAEEMGIQNENQLQQAMEEAISDILDAGIYQTIPEAQEKLEKSFKNIIARAITEKRMREQVDRMNELFILEMRNYIGLANTAEPNRLERNPEVYAGKQTSAAKLFDEISQKVDLPDLDYLKSTNKLINLHVRIDHAKRALQEAQMKLQMSIEKQATIKDKESAKNILKSEYIHETIKKLDDVENELFVETAEDIKDKMNMIENLNAVVTSGEIVTVRFLQEFMNNVPKSSDLHKEVNKLFKKLNKVVTTGEKALWSRPGSVAKKQIIDRTLLTGSDAIKREMIAFIEKAMHDIERDMGILAASKRAPVK
jgi:hypothetical protein